MKYPDSAVPEEKGIEINIIKFLRALVKRWWIIVLIAVIGGSAGFTIAEITKTPTYSSTFAFVVSNKGDDEVFSSSDIAASIKMANTYKYILSGRTLSNLVASKCSFDVTPEMISNSFEIATIDDSNIIEMKVTTKSIGKSYEIAQIVATNYKDVVDAAGFANSTLNLCESPEAAKKPNYDSTNMQYAIIAMFAIVFLATIVMVVIDFLKDSVQSVEDIKSKLGLKVLGVITNIGDLKGKKRFHKRGSYSNNGLLIDDKRVGFSFVETFKAIRTKIESDANENGHKTILITSAGENEGKTTVAVNIAIVLAQNGRAVLLIDADLRKPSVNKTLNIPATKDKGLQDVVSGKASVESALKYVEKYKLFVLAGSASTEDSAEVLAMPQIESLLETAGKEFDYIIIDTAPASVVTDASVIARSADAAIMVIKDDTMPINRIKMAMADITGSGAEIIGCIYNNVPYSTGKFYSIYRYASRKYEYGNYGSSYGYYGKKYGHGHENSYYDEMNK
ncbi:MAG TPA: polysaccharide biosynthesis tyrosine autokinase [Clostridia bacterium]|nr:polysaccharide biosynthesis tyrosine autokinase [Clostridia bacterium]